MRQTSLSPSSASRCSVPIILRRGLSLLAITVAVFTTPAQAQTPPEGADKIISVRPESTTTLMTADWGFTDTDLPPHTFSAVKITSLPAIGTLRVDGVEATVGQIVSVVQPGPAGVTWTSRESNRAWQSITSSADGTKLAAVVWGDYIYTSTDSGVTWLVRAGNSGGHSITSSDDGSKLAAAVNNHGQIYTSTDSGATWTARESNRIWHSITSSADGSKLAAVAVNGRIYTSMDFGVTWTPRESNRIWRSITSSADGSKLAAVVNGGLIYTSADSGVTWAARESSRKWWSITSSKDGSKLAAVVFGGRIYTSTDSGVTWTVRESSREWSSITSSDDGSKLAAVVDGGQIYTSTDHGVTWTARESNRGWFSITSSADGSKLAAVVNGGQIYTSFSAIQAITYTAPTGTGMASFSFQVQDSASADNLDPSANTLSFDIKSFPQISTPASASITRTTAILSGDVTSDGNSAITERGVVYSLTSANPNPEIGGSSVTQVTATGTTGFFTSSVTGLTGDRSYSFKAYATNSVGTAYSSVAIFTTRATPPEGTDKSFNVQAHSVTTLKEADWGFTDTDSPPHSFSAVKITSLPTMGTLKVDGVNATVDQLVSAKPTEAGVVWTAREKNRKWESITSSADGSKLAAVVAGGQIYTSTDSGVTWRARESNRYWQSITSSSDGSRLAAVVGAGQIYTSTDFGVTWKARESNRLWQSITSSADGRKLAAVVNNRQIYTSTDFGATWTARESNRNWKSITSSADGSKLAAVDYYGIGGVGGKIYTSTDSGATWTARESNRNWASITSSADGNKLAAVAWGGQIYTSTDSGATWTARESNRNWASITTSADGSKLAAVDSGDQIYTPADGSKPSAVDGGGQIYTSTDYGVTWTARESNRWWRSITSSADGSKLSAVDYGSIIGSGRLYTSRFVPAQIVTYTAPAGTANFTFQVQDSASADNLDLSPNTLTFDFDQTVPTVDGPLVRNPKTGLFEQNITVTNNLMGVTMPGFRLIVTNLPNGIDFTNKTHSFLPVIDSFVDLSPGDSRVVKVSFRISDRNLLTWQPIYQVLSLGATERDLPTKMSGSYAGLIQRSAEVHLTANSNVGARIEMTMSTTGAVTGAITEGSTKSNFVTKLSLDPEAFTAPYFKVALPKTDKVLEITFDNSNAVFTGALTRPIFIAPGVEVYGLQKVWTKTRTAAAYAGRHNYAISNPSTTVGPQGFGYGSYTITGSTGGYVLAGKMADGSTITGSGFVGSAGQVFVYQPLYANRSSAMGFQQIQLGLTLAEGTFSGELDWFKPAPASMKSTDLIYRNGFGPLTLTCAGGYYTAPASGRLLMGLSTASVGTANAEIQFQLGGLDTERAEFQTPLRIYNTTTTPQRDSPPKDGIHLDIFDRPQSLGSVPSMIITAATPLAPNLEKMRISKFDMTTGLFTGSFIRPAQSTAPARTVAFEGQISYDEETGRELGWGFFLMPQIPFAPQTISTSPRLSGSVRIVPAGSP